jgi:hypothetical protein
MMKNLQIDEPAILIRINKTFNEKMSSQSLYDYTRGRWKLSEKRAKKAQFGLAVYDGLIQEVYEIKDWHKAGTTESTRRPNDRPDLNSTKSLVGRIEFTGKVAPAEIREKYVGKSVRHFFLKGNANPVKYMNI